MISAFRHLRTLNRSFTTVTSVNFSTATFHQPATPPLTEYSPVRQSSPGDIQALLSRFQPSYIVTEADMKLSSRYAAYPIRKFSLQQGLGLETNRFINLVKPYYQTMEWDYYDVRREHVQKISKALPSLPSSLEELTKAYYKGEKSFQELLSALPASVLSEEFLRDLQRVLPFRKKAATTFHVTFEPNLTIYKKETAPIAQLVTSADIRSIPRKYPEIAENLIQHSLFQKFLQRVCLFVKVNDPKILEMDVVLWQTSLTPTKEQAASNSPEGIHQDGADYIISALVMERENIEGAESVIYEEDKQTEIYRTALNPGEGIFQVDTNTPVWHTVTPVTVSGDFSHGKRNSLGFDFFNLVRKSY